jgi:hypothetical protein
MFPPFRFLIQEFFICYFYCQKTAFVCEFQHTPLWKIIFFSRFHTVNFFWLLKASLHQNARGGTMALEH